MKLLAALAILSGVAMAQTIVSGGVRATLHELTVEVSVERPSFNLFGVRWGPVVSARTRVPMPRSTREPTATAVAGVTGTINMRDSNWAVQVQVLTRAAFTTTSSPRFSPELVVAFVVTP